MWMKAELVPLNGDPPVVINRDVTLIGRREYCDVVIEHPSLSKRHCVLVRTDGLLIVRDLVSTNGTKVNGQRVMWAALLPNDRLTIGRCKYRIYLGPDDALSPSELGQRHGDAAVPAGAAVATAVAEVVTAAPKAQTGFATPSPLSLLVFGSTPQNGSTDPEAELEILDDDNDLEILEDESDPYV